MWGRDNFHMSMVFVFRPPGMYEHEQRKYVSGPVSSYEYIVKLTMAIVGQRRPDKCHLWLL